ncbi:hypothetical protein BLOT_015541 [Blomia tropicalis]|nr:hypothetical protein BLOT_015541 [Blomia tropicalis]
MSAIGDGPVTYVERSAPHYTASMSIRGKVQSTGVGEELIFNPTYFTTISGLLKLIQLILAIIALSCISPPLTWFSRLFTFFLAITFALTLLLCFAYLVTLQKVLFPRFNWLLTEFIYTGCSAAALFITAIIHIVYTCRSDYRTSLTYFNSYLGTSYFGTYVTAGVFGILNSFAYAAGTYFLFNEWQHSTNTVSPISANNNFR